MQAAHNVGGPGAQWIPVAAPYQGLGSQMDHDLRLRPEHQNLEGLEVGKIADLVMPTMTGGPGRNQLTEEIRGRFWFKSEGPHLGAELLQPEQQPTALETGVTCEQHPPTSPEKGVNRHHHTFQGALAFTQRSSKCTRSRNVSIGCQKPVC